jgi:hypothetical protein
MVNKLRPDGWDRFGDYVCGRHPDELDEEMRHWGTVFPNMTGNSKMLLPFPDLENPEDKDSDSHESDVQFAGVKQRTKSKDPATDPEGVGGEEE